MKPITTMKTKYLKLYKSKYQVLAYHPHGQVSIHIPLKKEVNYYLSIRHFILTELIPDIFPYWGLTARVRERKRSQYNMRDDVSTYYQTLKEFQNTPPDKTNDPGGYTD